MMNLILAIAMLQEDGSGSGDSAAGGILGIIFGMGFLVVWLAFMLLIVASAWKVFAKANKPGWAALIPIYNVIVMLEISGKPIWWIALMFIPFFNIAVAFMIMQSLAEKFGKGTGFAVGLLILPFIFYPMLAFGDARYQG